MTDYKDLAHPLCKCCILQDSFFTFLGKICSLRWYDTCFWNATAHAKTADSWADSRVFWISLFSSFIRSSCFPWWMLRGQKKPAGRHCCLQGKIHIKLRTSFHKTGSKEDQEASHILQTQSQSTSSYVIIQSKFNLLSGNNRLVVGKIHNKPDSYSWKLTSTNTL